MQAMVGLIALIFFVALVVGGVFVNVFLYTRGVVSSRSRMGELAAVTLSQEASTEAEDLFYLGIGMHDETMNNYMRKTLVAFGAAILVVSLLGAAAFNLVTH